ncbi:MAG: hypothetical protein CMJ58_09555 [Planctomycetaceae bacterium]|nr:hypothetical protein [Planctomycetaceae bacterium]
MGRRKRYALAAGDAAAAPRASRRTNGASLLKSDFHLFGTPKPSKMKPAEATFLLRNLSTLVGNGVSLPKALQTLAKEDSLASHRATLERLCQRVESGTPFSTALNDFPHVIDRLAVSQIRIAERSGTLADTLKHLAENRDKFLQLRQQLVKKLAYPALLVVLGTGLVTFLMMYVVPVFQETYADAGVPLPFITQALIVAAGLAKKWFWVVAGGVACGILAVTKLRNHPELGERIDRRLLRMPLLGDWLRDMAVLRVMDVLHNLMASGFTLAEALRQTSESAGNRAVRRGMLDLQHAVQRGERFSREIERHESLFPPIVYQLVVVGENTGQLTSSTREVCEHLRREIERRTTLMVGVLEPAITISLAGVISVILLAIYLPMFDMINTIN